MASIEQEDTMKQEKLPTRALAVAIAAGFAPAPALASDAAPQATYTVSNCTDHDPGSLRAVIASVPDGSTITMGGACTPITLDTALIVNQNALTIDLWFSNRYGMVLDAGHRDRVIFHAGSGKLSLRNMAIANGAASLDDGTVVGGCLWSQGAIELADSVVSGCELTTKDGTALGGGVYAHGGLYLTDATLTGNLAWASGSGSAKGGGAYSKQRLYARYSTVTGNNAKYDMHNTIASAGGGLYAASIVTIQSSVIDNNRAGLGAGIEIHSNGGSATVGHLVNSTMSGNTAANGGGGVATNAIIEIDNSTIAFNAAQSSSGGAECWSAIASRSVFTARSSPTTARRAVRNTMRIWALHRARTCTATTILSSPPTPCCLRERRMPIRGSSRCATTVARHARMRSSQAVQR
jgi:hypothetical protein